MDYTDAASGDRASNRAPANTGAFDPTTPETLDPTTPVTSNRTAADGATKPKRPGAGQDKEVSLASLQDLLLAELRGLTDAEQQGLSTMKSLADRVGNAELQKALDAYWRQTEDRGARLERIIQQLDKHTTAEVEGSSTPPNPGAGQ